MPGGAPLKRVSTRPCKYGPRDAEGRCPKKPSSKRSSSSAPASKPSRKASARPCKYGDRINGKCPPKPKQVKQLKSVDAAAKQAGEVLRSSKATKEQKHEAVRVLGTAVATETTKKVGENVYREAKVAAKKAIKGNPAAKTAAINAAKKAAKVAGAATVTGVLVSAGAAGIKREHEKNARAYAAAQLAETRKRLKPQTLTKDQADKLYDQYYRYALKKPAATNSFLGK